MNNFLGIEILWICLGDHYKIGLYLGGIYIHFRVFSEGQGTEWQIFFFGCLNLKYFLGCLEFLIFFMG